MFDLGAPRQLGTLGEALARQAEQRPEHMAVIALPDRGKLTYRELDTAATGFSAGLVGHGVAQGEVVGVMLRNGLEFSVCWFGIARRGAIMASMNHELRSAGLANQIVNSQCSALVVDAATLPDIVDVLTSIERLRLVIVVGSPTVDVAGREVTTFNDLVSTSTSLLVLPELDEFSPVMFLSTSGTTGWPKPCVLSHHWAMNQAGIQRDQLRLTADDVVYSPLPNFHANGTTHHVLSTVVVGGTAAVGRKFSASRYWDEVRAGEVTVFDFIGTTLAMLWKQPPSPRDRDHGARLGWGEPIPEWGGEFEKRFGVRLVEAYGSTQAGACIYDPLDEPHRPGSCGRGVPGYEFKIVDEVDAPLPAGKVGELLIRGTERGVMFDGYYGMPEQTASVMVGDWFRSGDFMSVDEDGFFYYHGRTDDSIRRRGEFVSSFEAEQAIVAEESVLEVAVVAVPDDVSGEEAMAYVVPRPGRTIDMPALLSWCEQHLPDRSIPRYFQTLESIPKSPTGKVQKRSLRERGLSPAAFDRIAERATSKA